MKGNVGTFGSGTGALSPMTLQWLDYVHVKSWLQVYKSRKIAEKAVRSKFVMCTIHDSKQEAQKTEKIHVKAVKS